MCDRHPHPQAHAAVVAGACLAVGLRHAGSANARAEALLRHHIQYFLAAKQRAPEPGTGAWRLAPGACASARALRRGPGPACRPPPLGLPL